VSKSGNALSASHYFHTDDYHTSSLHYAPLGKGAGALAHDDMIQGPDLHQGQGFFLPLGNALIGLARLGDPAWMVMGQDGSGRVMPQGALDGFSPTRISVTPCHHWARRQFLISHGWLHRDL